MTRVVRRQGAAERLGAVFRRVTLAGAQGGAASLREKLSGAGSGRSYPGLPNRSSAVGEYPAEQSGELRDSIDARRLEGTRSGFGSLGGPDYVSTLHFKPPDAGGRPFLDDAKHDRDIHQAIAEAVREEVRT